ncbi:TadA family conjugal transfer-associated ATPase [Gordonia liuliyuniae]|uniref:TadA family conjugal transfer-associated ATPase n=1 Tax=Gordonia liuliyuniae TaxID=2911517 RepID=A0ABS9ISZ8_9ACTN|nr:TadA family conjugal transfer-associated ATPase [Gordonia liuliyuniae]MCF8588684.1 TadA family conjugal transfer-associated ATPase [Gordonia liuliyuniae]
MTAVGRADLLDRVRDRLATQTSDPEPAVIADAIRAESGGLLGDTDLLDVLRYLQTEMVGAGRLEGLLADPDVTDVLVVGPDRVWADRGDGLELTGVRFDDEASVRRLAGRLALGAGRRLDEAQPWVDGQLAGVGRRDVTVRLHAVIPPLAVDGTCISLRVLRGATQTFDALVKTGSIPGEAADLLREAVAARLAFLIVGGTGSGKTTLLNALLGQVDPGDRVVTVEDASELAPQHPHIVRLVSRNANVEGVGNVPVRALVRQALRMRPDRIVVGEVRGAEVIDLLIALNTGHDGCAGTLHANSTSEVPARMEALAALGGMDRAALHSQLAAAIQLVLGLGRDRDGHRGLLEIGVLTRADDGLTTIERAWSRRSGFTAARARIDALIADRRPR